MRVDLPLRRGSPQSPTRLPSTQNAFLPKDPGVWQKGAQSLVDTDGVVRDTFVALLSASGQPVRNPGAWLFTVARNQVSKVPERYPGPSSVPPSSQPPPAARSCGALAACPRLMASGLLP
jgi:hypothetical protein